MYQATIKAQNVQDHFELMKSENCFNHLPLRYIRVIDDFPYPKFYFDGADNFNEFLLVNSKFIIYNDIKYNIYDYMFSKYCDLKYFIEDDEYFTFEFETEEEALYFQLKYGY